MKHSTPHPNEADQARFDAIKEIGCLCCLRAGFWTPCEVHHLLSGNRRRGHRYTIGLCCWHHRAIRIYEVDTGPSLADGGRLFRLHFGTDDELLKEQDERIADFFFRLPVALAYAQRAAADALDEA
jgi:hypothetical protein